MDATLQSPGKHRTARYLGIVVVLIAAAVVIWLLMRGCEHPHGAFRFDYFRVKAEDLGRDEAKIKAFVANDVKKLDYSGQKKGPLGCLWDGGGSAEEKQALEEALLACCDTGVESPDIDASTDPAKSQPLAVKLEVIDLKDGKEVPRGETKAFGVGALVSDVHSVEFPASDKVKLTLRPYFKEPVVMEATCGGAAAVNIVFTLGDPKKGGRVITRELWHKDNRVGINAGRPGDRHDFVVLPARVGKYVREKEEFRLKESGRDKAPEAAPLLSLLDYAKESDEHLAESEKKLDVQAQFDEPRILFWTRLSPPKGFGESMIEALDLRHNYVRFSGKTLARQAAEGRGWAEAGLEQKWLEEKLKRPVRSALTVFNMYATNAPNTVDKRLQRMEQALASLQAGEAATFRATWKELKGPAREAKVSRLANGKLEVTAAPIRKDFAEQLAKNPEAVHLKGGEPIKQVCENESEAAALVETALLAAEVGDAPPMDYTLDTVVARSPESLVVPASRFHFAWGSGEDRTEQFIRVEACAAELVLQWRLDAGVRPMQGTRVISADAVEKSEVHNPWYRPREKDAQAATSFILSRALFAKLKKGERAPISMLARYGPDDDETAPRKVEWKGEIEPLGSGEIEVLVNNKREKLPILKVRIAGQELAILDDARFPVGMADRLVDAHVAVHCILRDELGAPIPDATIDLDGVQERTSPEGTFTLQPRTERGYGSVKCKVAVGAEKPVERELDLSAPGLSVVTITAPRPPSALVWIKPSEANKLDGLQVSDQIKRHARYDLASGNCVCIPTRMVGAWPVRTCAYWAWDAQTGHTTGVLENGLHGADDWFSDSLIDEWEKAAKEKLEEAAQESITADRMAAFHAYRGALTSWWVYCSYRVGGAGHAAAILLTLQSMMAWEKATDMFAQAGTALGDLMGNAAAGEKAIGKLKELASKAINMGVGSRDDSEKAFILGYVAGTLNLAARLADSG